MTDRIKLAVLGLIAALIFVGGMALAWKIWAPKPAKPETYAAAVKQSDGSVVLERKPDATAKPAQELPKGAKLERVVQVTVKPSASSEAIAPTNGPDPQAASTSDLPSGTTIPCPPIRVDLSLVRMPDESRRVIASSPDGEVISGIDVPVDGPKPQRELHWNASVIRTWEPMTGHQHWGGYVQRSAGPFVIGLGGWSGNTFATVGVKF